MTFCAIGPIKYIGVLLFVLLQYISINMHNSCALLKAKIGIKTFPPFDNDSPIFFKNSLSLILFVYLILSPYVVSIIKTSGNIFGI